MAIESLTRPFVHCGGISSSGSIFPVAWKSRLHLSLWVYVGWAGLIWFWLCLSQKIKKPLWTVFSSVKVGVESAHTPGEDSSEREPVHGLKPTLTAMPSHCSSDRPHFYLCPYHCEGQTEATHTTGCGADTHLKDKTLCLGVLHLVSCPMHKSSNAWPDKLSEFLLNN